MESASQLNNLGQPIRWRSVKGNRHEGRVEADDDVDHWVNNCWVCVRGGWRKDNIAAANERAGTFPKRLGLTDGSLIPVYSRSAKPTTSAQETQPGDVSLVSLMHGSCLDAPASQNREGYDVDLPGSDPWQPTVDLLSAHRRV
jgi:hypothetical protein